MPALLGVFRAGEPSTRYTIAGAQMLMGALLIHLTGGRLETHFHVFGSLAFLAFYRDESTPSGWNNLVFPNVAMPHVLWQQGGTNKLVATEYKSHDEALAAEETDQGEAHLARQLDGQARRRRNRCDHWQSRDNRFLNDFETAAAAHQHHHVR